MTPAPKSLARGGLFCCSALILEAIFGFSCPDVFLKKSRFWVRWTFHDCWSLKKKCPRSGPEVSGRCMGPSPTYSGPYRRPLLFRQIIGKQIVIFSHSHENDILGHFVFRRSFFGHILELCRTRCKRLENLLFRNGSWRTCHIEKIHI